MVEKKEEEEYSYVLAKVTWSSYLFAYNYQQNQSPLPGTSCGLPHQVLTPKVV